MKLNDAFNGRSFFAQRQAWVGGLGLVLVLYCVLLQIGQTAHQQLVGVGEAFFPQNSQVAAGFSYRQLRNPLPAPTCSPAECPNLHTQYLEYTQAISPALELFRAVDVSVFNWLVSGLEIRPFALVVVLALAVWMCTWQARYACWRQPETQREFFVHESVAMVGNAAVAFSSAYYAHLHHAALAAGGPLWALLGCTVFFMGLGAVHAYRLWHLKSARHRSLGRFYFSMVAVAPLHSLVLLATAVLLLFGSHWAGFGVYLLTFADYADIFLGLGLWVLSATVLSACVPFLLVLQFLTVETFVWKGVVRRFFAALVTTFFLGVVLPGSLFGPYLTMLNKTWTALELQTVLWWLFAVVGLSLLGYFLYTGRAWPLLFVNTQPSFKRALKNHLAAYRLQRFDRMAIFLMYVSLALAVWGVLDGLLGLPLTLETAPVFAAFLALVWFVAERLVFKPKIVGNLLSVSFVHPSNLVQLTYKAMLFMAALALLIFASLALATTLGRVLLPMLMSVPLPWPPGMAWATLAVLVLLSIVILEPFGFILMMVLVLWPWVQTLGMQDQHWLWVVCLGALFAFVCSLMLWRGWVWSTHPIPILMGFAALALCIVLGWGLVAAHVEPIVQQDNSTVDTQLPITLLNTSPSAMPVAKELPGGAAEAEQQVGLLLQRWADAWSAQNVQAYLAMYAPGFVSRRHQSHTEWAAERTVRLLSKRFISVKIVQVQIQRQGDLMRVRFVQHYENERFHERSHKELWWEKTPDGWKIVRELQR